MALRPDLAAGLPFRRTFQSPTEWESEAVHRPPCRSGASAHPTETCGTQGKSQAGEGIIATLGSVLRRPANGIVRTVANHSPL